uniref:Vomeronasal type-1 receptor n=1 Tax=Ditylenchus dipsaci TaxID=166011 RepID=A0A915EFR9_9BILA
MGLTRGVEYGERIRLTHTINCYVCFVLGCFLNCLLIYLIKKKTVNEMKMYSRILLQTCFNNLYNLAISALVQPIYILEGDRSIIFHNGMLRTSPPSIQHITYLAWFLGFYFSALFLPVQFIYRYLVLCK